MELPFHLKALPPEALDVLRFYGSSQLAIAHAEEITDGVGLSERTFGKVIRRLVTKGYLQMDGDQAYRLTDQGQEAVENLGEFDAVTPAAKAEQKVSTAAQVTRRLVLVTPRPFITGKPAEFHIGFHPADDDHLLDGAVDIALRVSAIHGELARPQEAGFALDNQPVSRTFKVTPGKFNRMRLKVTVFQLGPNPDDIAVVGGMHVDAEVAAFGSEATAAYGVDLKLTQPE